MFEEFNQTRTLKFDMITMLVWNERDFMFNNKLNTKKRKDGEPKPHLLLNWLSQRSFNFPAHDSVQY